MWSKFLIVSILSFTVDFVNWLGFGLGGGLFLLPGSVFLVALLGVMGHSFGTSLYKIFLLIHKIGILVKPEIS